MLHAAGAALFEKTIMNTEKLHLMDLALLVPEEIAPNVVVCEFSSEDDTQTLHVDLWRGFDLSDLPCKIASLKVAAEGYWDGGKCYSLQLQ